MKHNKLFRFGLKHYRLSIVFALFLLLGLTLLNAWLFNTFFNRSYFSWYVKVGPLIGLVSTVAATAWGGLDKEPGFISKNPYEYLGTYFQLVGVTLSAYATILNSKSHNKRPSLFDYLVGIILAIIFSVAALVWLVVIIPFQYFVFLICGSIPRLALNSSIRLVAWFEDNQVKIEERPVSEVIPSNGWDASMRDNPFKVASAFSAAFLFLLGPLLG